MPRNRRRQYGDGSIYPDKTAGGFVAQIYVNGKSIRRRAASREAAETLLKELRAQRDSGIDITGASQTVAAFAEVWYNQVILPRKLKPNTNRSYKCLLEVYIIPDLGAYRLDAPRSRDMQMYLNGFEARITEHKKPFSSGTVNQIYSILKGMYDTALKWEYVVKNPMDGVERPRVTHAKKRALEIAETRALWKAAETHRMGAIYPLMSILGFRTGEALGLRWADYNRQERSIAVKQQVQHAQGGGGTFLEPKTKASIRTLPLTEELMTLLERHWKTQLTEREQLGMEWKEHGLMFPNDHGYPVSPASLRSQFGYIVTRAGLEHVGLHQLRHTAATRLMESGAHPYIIAAILGHATRTQTEDYSDVSVEAMRGAVEKAERLLYKKAQKKREG